MSPPDVAAVVLAAVPPDAVVVAEVVVAPVGLVAAPLDAAALDPPVEADVPPPPWSDDDVVVPDALVCEPVPVLPTGDAVPLVEAASDGAVVSVAATGGALVGAAAPAIAAAPAVGSAPSADGDGPAAGEGVVVGVDGVPPAALAPLDEAALVSLDDGAAGVCAPSGAPPSPLAVPGEAGGPDGGCTPGAPLAVEPAAAEESLEPVLRSVLPPVDDAPDPEGGLLVSVGAVLLPVVALPSVGAVLPPVVAPPSVGAVPPPVVAPPSVGAVLSPVVAPPDDDWPPEAPLDGDPATEFPATERVTTGLYSPRSDAAVTDADVAAAVVGVLAAAACC